MSEVLQDLKQIGRVRCFMSEHSLWTIVCTDDATMLARREPKTPESHQVTRTPYEQTHVGEWFEIEDFETVSHQDRRSLASVTTTAGVRYRTMALEVKP